MHKFIFSEKENKDLQAANEKQKQKRTRSRRQIAYEEGLSVSEAHGLIEASIEAQTAPGIPQEGHTSLPIQPPTRPPRGCGICRVPGHRRETCPNRPR